MREIDELGHFWIDGYEADSLSGRLRFNPNRTPELEIVGNFENGKEHVTIHGWIGTEKVTLPNVYLYAPRQNGSGVNSEIYRGNQLFLGHHLQANDMSFQSGYYELSHLAEWIGEFGWEYTDLEDSNRTSFRITRSAAQEHPVDGGRVFVRFTGPLNDAGIDGISFRQYPTIGIEYDTIQPLKRIQRDLGRLEALLILCFDDTVYLDRCVLRRPDVKEQMLSGEEVGEAKDIDLLAPRVAYKQPADRGTVNPYRMLLTYKMLGGLPAVASWLDGSRKFQRVLDYMISVQRRPMFMESRFLNVVGAAEAFHRAAHPSDVVPAEEFERLYKAYLEITPAEHREWLAGKIGFAIEPSLKSRLLRLAKQSQNATSAMTGSNSRKRDDWAWTVATLRNWLAHVVVDGGQVSGTDMRILAESTYSVLRICLLLECGLDETILPSLRDSAAHELSANIDDVVTRVANVLKRRIRSVVE